MSFKNPTAEEQNAPDRRETDILQNISELGQSLEDLKTQHAEYTDKKTELSALKKDIEIFTKSRDSIRSEMFEKQSELDELHRTYDAYFKEVQQESETRQTALSELEIEILKTGSELEALKVEHAQFLQEKNSAIETLENKIRDLLASTEDLNKKYEETSLRFGELSLSYQQLQSDATTLGAKVAESSKTVNTNAQIITDLDLQIVNKTNDLNKIKSDNEIETAKFNSLIESKKAELDVREKAVTTREGNVSIDEDRLNKKAEELRQTKASLQDYYGRDLKNIII